jgi:CBS domain-containing protein/sporulation protein YlmC with PRC-barrel domain
MAESLLYFTELLGLPVLDLKGRRIGRVRDAALVPLVHPARIDRFLVGGGWAWLTIRYDQIASISLDGIRLSQENLTPYHSDEYMLRMGRDLLDQQIIDVNGRKVVRVTDVTFEIRNVNGNGNSYGGNRHHGNGQVGADSEVRKCLYILEVDVGIRSIVRRLLQGVMPPRWIRKLQRTIPPKSIRWEFCNIVEADPQRRLRLNISHDKLEKIHPADLADIVEELGPAERGAIFESIDSEVAAEALSEIDPKMQASILESLEPEKAADIVEEMAPDEAANLLKGLEESTSEEILDEMEVAPESEVRELLEFKEDTAGGMMNTEYISLHDGATVEDALRALKGNEDQLESLNALFLVDSEGRLTGTVPLARLFVAAIGTPLKALAAETLISASVDEKQDEVTELFDKYNLLALPVVDEEKRLAGVITADDIISVLRHK